MKKLIAAREAFESPHWLGGLVGADSFRPMRTLALAALGEPLAAEELSIYRELTGGRPAPPAGPVNELWILAGRRSGKTVVTAALASYLAACVNWRDCLTQGERAALPVLASTTAQARSLLNITRGIFADNPRFAALVENITADAISLRNRVDLSIRPASYRSIRGITACGAIMEEISAWHDAELGSKNPDKEILNAVRPSLATTGGMLVCIGSPLFKSGEAWKAYKRHFGPNGAPDIIVANGPTRRFNPTISQATIDRALEEDPASAASEWLGQFRDGAAAFVPVEVVESCVDAGIRERPWGYGKRYLAHVDVSGGGSDSFALAIAHLEDGIGVWIVSPNAARLCRLREPSPSFARSFAVIASAASLATLILANSAESSFEGMGSTTERTANFPTRRQRLRNTIVPSYQYLIAAAAHS